MSLQAKFRTAAQLTIDNKRKNSASKYKNGATGNDDVKGGYFLLSLYPDSSWDVFAVAKSGNIQEFEKLYFADTHLLSVRDKRGQTAFHYAASTSKIVIMDFILGQGGDINIQDNKGNTPLHIAVEHSHLDSVNYLITKGADTKLLNNDHLSPLHLAVDLNKPGILEVMLKNPEVCPNTPGENGMGPLHYAACKNNLECAKILLDNKARLCVPSEDGLYPIHYAAKHASSEVLKLLLDEAEKYGYNRRDILKYMNKENNTALHSAVNSGDVGAIRICIEAGSEIDAAQEDLSTPIHLACSQGAFETIKVMFELQPLKVDTVLSAEDVNGMTPLHKAAMFDHVEIVTYLLDKGAYIDAQDKDERTALHVAASKRCILTMRVLLGRGADAQQKDKNGRHFFHIAIKKGTKLSQLKLELPAAGYGPQSGGSLNKLMNERDDFGCSAMHYASKEGHFGSLEELIAQGAHLNIKDNDRQSPLHFAAKYGRVNTCRKLLESVQGPHIINDTDRDGLTSLHIAAQNGHTKVVSLLMQKGLLLHRDNNGNSPLHLAAENGYTQTMKLVLGVHPHLVNEVNNDGDTALHIASREGKPNAVTLMMSLDAEFLRNNEGQGFFDVAIKNKHKDVAMAIITHDRWEEAMGQYSSSFGSPMSGLIQYLPEVCLSVLDRCKSHPPLNTKAKDFYHKYDFQYLQCPVSCAKQYGAKGKTKHGQFQPLRALNHMVKYNRVDCLSHPVCVEYLAMKWRAYGLWFHGFNLVQYLLFVGFFTSCLVTSSSMEHFRPVVNSQNKTKYEEQTDLHGQDLWHRICLFVILAFCLINLVKEFVQMYQQKIKYLFDVSNLIDWILYISTFIFIMPGILGISTHYQWEAGALAIFLAWFNLLFFMQRWEMFGIYIVMFMEILRTLLHVVAVFSILIIAFSLAFFLLLSDEVTGSFKTVGLSIFTTAIMMLGEIDFRESFVQPYVDGNIETLHFGEMTLVILVAFVLLMPILLMNLLIGLAVGDIESVQRSARLKRLAMTVDLHTDLEKKLPLRFLKYVDKTELVLRPNSQCMLNKWFHKVTSSDIESNDNECDYADSNQYIADELLKQKQRIKDISSNLEKQYDLLRLIIRKMEIKAESDDTDEGSSFQRFSTLIPAETGHRAMSSPVIRRTVMKQAAISQWKHSTDL